MVLGGWSHKTQGQPHLAVANSVMHPPLGSPSVVVSKLGGEILWYSSPQQVEFDSLYLSAGWTWYVLPESRIQPTSGGIISEMRVSKTVASF